MIPKHSNDILFSLLQFEMIVWIINAFVKILCHVLRSKHRFFSFLLAWGVVKEEIKYYSKLFAFRSFGDSVGWRMLKWELFNYIALFMLSKSISYHLSHFLFFYPEGLMKNCESLITSLITKFTSWNFQKPCLNSWRFWLEEWSFFVWLYSWKISENRRYKADFIDRKAKHLTD